MSEQPKGFTVNDRRHFTADGSRRDVREEPSPPVGSEAKDAAGPEARVDFGGFLLSLAGQASLLLGLDEEGAKEGGEKEPQPDLAGARQIISILEMLKDKTEGRRSAEEDRLLEGILYELRMAWMSRARAGVA
ncbi:MAG TPA: DUF1844 domain-containing protein [Solirubrobacterales bacterium]|nr:DUF1844 domain-containing protein [Solirubrobacterales bacterium]